MEYLSVFNFYYTEYSAEILEWRTASTNSGHSLAGGWTAAFSLKQSLIFSE
jgi:hypothetical protein